MSNCFHQVVFAVASVVSRMVTQVLFVFVCLFVCFICDLVITILNWQHSEHAIHPEMTLCGWRDVKIQDLINYDYVEFVAEEEENEGSRGEINNTTITTHNNSLWTKKERKSNKKKQQARIRARARERKKKS